MGCLSEVVDGLVRIPLVYTSAPGTVFEQGDNKFRITDAELGGFLRNLAEREIPIDYEHHSARATVLPPGWAKAAGWLAKPDSIDPFTDNRKLLWGWARFTPAMLAMIKDEEYRYCSIDFGFSDKDETGESVGAKIRALAMTNRPFLRDLPPIEISNEDYQQLMGMTMRQDGKLAAICLSEGGARLLNPEGTHVPGAMPGSKGAIWEAAHPLSVREEKAMAKFCLKLAADGRHELFGPNGRVGEMDGQELRQYAKTHLKMKDCENGGGATASVRFSALVRETASSRQLSEEQARNVVAQSPQGKNLWKAMRLEELAASAAPVYLTQDKR
jgi:hypothetical protein